MKPPELKQAENPEPRFYTDILIFMVLILIGALIAFIDNRLSFHTILVEVTHAVVLTGILLFCLICQYKRPEIKQYGWYALLLGVILLTIGAWVDLLDDPPVIQFLNEAHPFGRTWQQAFIKKILGYTVGTSLIAYGFFQWIPWMIQTRVKVETLNRKIANSNQKMNRILMSLDEHIESERLEISRELHDEVAQQLTFLNIQLQLCRKELPTASIDATLERLKAISGEVSDTLKTVRQISRNLRPESLYALGFIAAFDQFLEKMRQHTPETEILLVTAGGEDLSNKLESNFSDRERLHLFRLLQEGLRNTIKHSQAKTIQLSILDLPTEWQFKIEDNGIGLPWTKLPSDESLVQEGHLGVVGMKERVIELKGQFRLFSSVSNVSADLIKHPPGTTMEITISHER